MTRVDLIGAQIDLPSGWRPVNAIFVAPPGGSSPVTPIPSLTKEVAFRESIAVAVEPIPRGTTPLAYHEAQVEQMRKSGQNVTIASRQDIQHDGFPALQVEIHTIGYRGEGIRQIHRIVVNGDEAWIAIATTLDGPGYSASRKRLLEIMASLSFRAGA